MSNYTWDNFETKHKNSSYSHRWTISEELKTFLGLENNVYRKLAAFRRINKYIGENRLYNSRSQTIYPDQKLATLVGKDELDYDKFVKAMGKHFLEAKVAINSYMYNGIRVSNNLEEFMGLEHNSETTRINVYRYTYKYIKRNQLVIPERNNNGFCLVQLDGALEILTGLEGQVRFHEIKKTIIENNLISETSTKEATNPIEHVLEQAVNDMDEEIIPNSQNRIPKVEPTKIDETPILDYSNGTTEMNISCVIRKLDKEKKQVGEEKFGDYTFAISTKHAVDIEDLVKKFKHQSDTNPSIEITNNYNLGGSKPKTHYQRHITKYALAAALASNTILAYTACVMLKQEYHIDYLSTLAACYLFPKISFPYYSLRSIWSLIMIWMVKQ